MKKIILLLITAIILLWGWVAYQSNPTVITGRLLGRGEMAAEATLRYRIYLFGFFPVGDAFLYSPRQESFEGQPVYHLRARAQSLKFLSFIFSGSTELDSYVDRRTLNPVLFRQSLYVKGKADTSKEVSYDQQNKEMTLAGVKRQILDDTQDHLSAIFKLRQMDFSVQKDFDININTNQKNYALKGSGGSSSTTVRGKPYALTLLHATVSRRDKNPYHRSSMDMAILKDRGNIPVLVKVFASGGVIHARLIGIEKE
ncbi:MAG: DUF3108 domain-containing protein [Candidatus Omnitrophica bacterium]|nr:DUF3108 domain-containing protein [Candidatus Omnitrophota bacterium]